MPATTSFFETAREIVAGQQAAAARQNTGGVSWSAMERRAVEVESVEDVAARLQADADRALAFRKTPRGRFLTAVEELEKVGFWDEAGRLLGIYNRSLTTLNGQDLDVAAVGDALAILNPMRVSTARAAIGALADLLRADMQAAA